MEDNNLVKEFEGKVRKELIEFLQKKGAIDKHIPECPDIEEKWTEIIHAYIPDGVREFQQYPIVSLGWIMFMGIAMAFYWDSDWENQAPRKDFYEKLRDENGYDNFDETIVYSLLGLEGECAENLTNLVAECASRVYNTLRHERIEPGTEIAFSCYVSSLHQLYLAGLAIELNALGYHMTPYSPASLN